MLKQFITCILISFLFSCTQQFESSTVATEKKLYINCENEKLLIENSNNNIAFSFDTILSTKSYWRNLKIDQNNHIGNKRYPYAIIQPDTPSICKEIKLSLVGYGEWKYDGRMKTVIINAEIDSNRISDFYKRVSSDTLESKSKAEIFLSFYRDSIVDFSKPLKEITQIYIDFQKHNSKELFKIDLCDLTKDQLDALKKNVPYRIRLMRYR